MPLVWVLSVTIFLSPLALSLAANQSPKTKSILRAIFISLLTLEILFGFLGWDTNLPENTGFRLALLSKSLLPTFFSTTSVQILLLLLKREVLDEVSIFLNFTNTIVFFLAMISASNLLGYEVFGLVPVAEAFLVLLGNVIGLTLINQDRQISPTSAKKPAKYLFPLIILIVSVISLSAIFLDLIPQLPTINQSEAIRIVRDLPEVRSFLLETNGLVVAENRPKDNEYLIHVFEIKDNHTATFNWYRINQKTGEVTKEF